MLVATTDVSFMLEDYAIFHRQNTAIGLPDGSPCAPAREECDRANYRSACHSLFPLVTASV
jgi:hypothetical protein